MAAGIWSARLGLRPVILEAGDALGGQLLRVYSPITDYPGIRRIDGPSLADRFEQHAREMGVDVVLGCRVTAIDGDPPRVSTRSHGIVDADAVVLATGVGRRTLGVTGETQLKGRGLSYTVSRDKQTVAGRDAVVVGGGDGAFEGVLILSDVCRRVHLVHRDNVCARHDFRRAVARRATVQVHTGRSVVAVLGDEQVTGVRLDDGTVLPCDGVFVRIGVEPRGTALCGELSLDEQGFVEVDRWNRCANTVYAVGDICSPQAMSVSVAVGQAMIACKHIQRRWVR